MLFYLKKIVASFLGIPGIFILAMLVAGWAQTRAKRKGGWVHFFLAALLYIFSASLTADIVAMVAEADTCSPAEFLAGRAPALYVVLGGGIVRGRDDQAENAVPVPDMICRLTDAVRLYRLHAAPILVSGGSPYDELPAEADVAVEFLQSLGIPRQHILTERDSRDTRQNARFVASIPQAGQGLVVLVTSAYHLPRAEYLFEKEGVQVMGFASSPLRETPEISLRKLLPEASALRRNAFYLRELAARCVYMVIYSM